MPSSATVRCATLGLLALCAFQPTQASAQSCRAQAIMTSQCAWFALEELGGSKQAAAQAQDEATSGLIAGCSQGEYQMVLLRGTGLTQTVIQRLRTTGTRDTAAVRAACAAEARRMAAR
jgi:hypothetical protein